MTTLPLIKLWVGEGRRVPKEDVEQPSLPGIQKVLPGIWGEKPWNVSGRCYCKSSCVHSRWPKGVMLPWALGNCPIQSHLWKQQTCQSRSNGFELPAFLVAHWESALREEIKPHVVLSNNKKERKRSIFSPESLMRLAIRANYIQLLNLMDLWVLVILGHNYRVMCIKW